MLTIPCDARSKRSYRLSFLDANVYGYTLLASYATLWVMLGMSLPLFYYLLRSTYCMYGASTRVKVVIQSADCTLTLNPCLIKSCLQKARCGSNLGSCYSLETHHHIIIALVRSLPCSVDSESPLYVEAGSFGDIIILIWLSLLLTNSSNPFDTSSSGIRLVTNFSYPLYFPGGVSMCRHGQG